MITLSLNILDIIQNSIRASADLISIEIEESAATDLYRITITDNGKGMPEAILEHVTDPFVTTRTKRRFGLGLSLLKYHAELTGGGIEIFSQEGKGTEVHASFKCSHIDRQPLGDIAGVLKIMIGANPGINFNYKHTTDTGEFCFKTLEAMEYLEVASLNDPGLLEDITAMIKENLKNINASGVQYE